MRRPEELCNLQGMYPGLSLREIDAILDRHKQEDASDTRLRNSYLLENGPRGGAEFREAEAYHKRCDEDRRQRQREQERSDLLDMSIRRRS